MIINILIPDIQGKEYPTNPLGFIKDDFEKCRQKTGV
jgi:hypothetical protein